MNDRSLDKTSSKQNPELNLFENYENALEKEKMESIQGYVD